MMSRYLYLYLTKAGDARFGMLRGESPTEVVTALQWYRGDEIQPGTLSVRKIANECTYRGQVAKLP